jgi:hypothetical protein
VSTTKKSSQYQRQRAIAENQYATLSVGLNLKNRQSVLIRDFKPGILSTEADWAGFRQLLEERRQTQVPGMLRVAGVGGSATQPYLVITGTTGQSLRNALSRLETPELSDLVQSLKTAALGLDGLHELGYVHGDVRPETLFFDAEDNLLLNELTTHYTLCGWGHRSHVMDARLFGTVFPTSYLAPEVRTGGPLTERTDQYALGLVLFELCTGLPPRETTNIAEALGGANVDPAKIPQLQKLRPVLERALSQGPQGRYPSCRAMLEDAEKCVEDSSVKPWVILGLTAAAALVLVGLLVAWMTSRKSPSDQDDWKTLAIEAIAEQYRGEIPRIPNATATPEAPATETTAVGPILEGIRAKLAEEQLGALKAQLKSVSLEVLAEPNAPSFRFLYAVDPTAILFLDANSAAAWKAVLQFENDLPDQELAVRVDVYDVDTSVVLAQVPLRLEAGKPMPADKAAWNTEQKTLTVDLGKVAAPKKADDESAQWTIGASLGVRVAIDTTSRQIWWNKSPTYRVGELARVRKDLELSPAEVQKQGYQFDTGVTLRAGQDYRLRATGRIQPGTEPRYLVMTGKKDRVPISPFGLAITSTGNTRHYPVSHDNTKPLDAARWGALIMKIGANADWEWPFDSPGSGDLDVMRTAESDGALILSIDSVKYIDTRIRARALVDNDHFWQPPPMGGQFDVTIESIQLSPEDLPAEISQSLLKSHGQLGTP